MYFSVSKKIFLLFLVQALLALFICLLVLYSVNSLNQNARQIELLKSFQFQIKNLENLSIIEVPRSHETFRKKIRIELAKIEELSSQISDTLITLPPYLHRALGDIKTRHINFYRTALEEQYDKQVKTKELQKENLNIVNNMLQKNHSSQVTSQIEQVNRLLLLFENYLYRIMNEKNPNLLAELKKVEKELVDLTDSNGNRKAIHRMIQNCEAIIINHYAILNRQSFFQSTSARFHEVAEKIINAYSIASNEKQRSLRIQIFLVMCAALILTFLLWFLANRYLQRFLQNQTEAISSIQAGQYEYKLHHSPNDELGDLMRFLQKLSSSFGLNLKNLIDSEKKYRLLIENVTDLVWETDEKLNFIYISPSISQILELETEEVVGKSVFQLMPETEGWDNKPILKKILKKQPFYNLESYNRHKSGSLIVLESSGQPKYGNGGTFQGYRGISRDITKRKKTEDILKESKRFLQSIIDGVSDPIMVIDTNHYIVLMNNAARAISKADNLDDDKLHCHYVSHLKPTPCDNNDLTCPLEEISQNGLPTIVTHEHVDNKGNTVYMEIMAYPLYDQSGDFFGIIESSRNITDRVTMEDELKNTRNFLHNIINSMPSTLIGVTRDGLITQMNNEASRYTGLPTDKAVGRPIDQIMPSFNKHINELSESISKKKIYKSTQYNSTEDGEIKCSEIMIYPLVSNGVEGAVIRIDDITDLVRLERQVTKSEEEKQSLQSQLIQAQKLESLGRLAGGVAHDFNNLLTGIIGYSELVMMQLDESHPATENIKSIHKAGRRAEDLTKQLLTFSRKQVLAMKPVNLNRIVENMVKMLKRVIGEDIILDVELEDGNKSIMADAGQLEQVLMNLAVNARDAMPAGGRLTIETSDIFVNKALSNKEKDLPIGHYVSLVICDNGAGMSQEIQEKIFEPFFTTKGVGKGTGLGLATVYGVIKQHKGHITVDSTRGRGTTFYIYLPRIEEKEDIMISDESVSVTEGNETILVVDDDQMTRKLLIDTLTPLGYDVLSASNGRDALEIGKTNSKQIYLLLTDVVMPEMNGKVLAERFLQFNPSCKVLFISGYTDSIITSLGVVTSQNIFFQPKPISPISLAVKIREILDGKIAPLNLK